MESDIFQKILRKWNLQFKGRFKTVNHGHFSALNNLTFKICFRSTLFLVLVDFVPHNFQFQEILIN